MHEHMSTKTTVESRKSLLFVTRWHLCKQDRFICSEEENQESSLNISCRQHAKKISQLIFEVKVPTNAHYQ